MYHLLWISLVYNKEKIAELCGMSLEEIEEISAGRIEQPEMGEGKILEETCQ